MKKLIATIFAIELLVLVCHGQGTGIQRLTSINGSVTFTPTSGSGSIVDLSAGTNGGGGGGTNTLPILNVLNYGVKGDGVTDDTAALNVLLGKQGVSLLFPSNLTYSAQELLVTNNVTLIGSARFTYRLGTANTNIFWRESLNTNINYVGEFTFDGQQYPNITTNTWFGWNNSSFANNLFTFPAILAFNYWQPWGLRHGFQYNTQNGGARGMINVRGFNGIGILPLSISDTSSYGKPKSVTLGMNSQSNLVDYYAFAPFYFSGYVTNWVTNYVPNAGSPEYQSIHGLTCGGGSVGIVFSAANSDLSDCDISGNYINAVEAAGISQNHHGMIHHDFFNHSIYWPFLALSSAQGEIMDDCQMRGNAYGAIYLNYCEGWDIHGCQFDSLIFTNANTPLDAGSGTQGINRFHDNTYYGYWGTNAIISTDGHLQYWGNTSYNVQGDYDGQAATLLMISNILSGASLNVTGASSLDNGAIITDGSGNLTALGGDFSQGYFSTGLESGGAALFDSTLRVVGSSSLDNGAITTDGAGHATFISVAANGAAVTNTPVEGTAVVTNSDGSYTINIGIANPLVASINAAGNSVTNLGSISVGNPATFNQVDLTTSSTNAFLNAHSGNLHLQGVAVYVDTTLVVSSNFSVQGNGSGLTGLVLPGYRAGRQAIANLSTSQAVAFTTPLASAIGTNYAVSITADSTLAAAIGFAATSKTTNGFTITLSAGITGGVTVDYTAWQNQ